jgi:hypothetical protein
MEEIRWDDLSKTFQDAVTITKEFGVAYIWIDSLCIIQDDGRDWEIESAKMADIYEGSILTISAALSPDGEGGCFSDNRRLKDDGTRVHPDPVELNYHDANGTPFRIHVQEIPHHPLSDDQFGNDTASQELLPLFMRAWAFQERLLATRVLHYTATELVWECRSAVNCECTQTQSNGPSQYFKWRFHGIAAQQTVFGDLALSPVQAKMLLWKEIVEIYAGRRLTKAEDKLPALSGIAKRSAITQMGRYLAGLWESELPQGLLWVVDRELPLASIQGSPPPLYRAPTWSWASHEGVPSWIHQFPDGPTVFATVVESHCVPAGLDPTGRVSDG